MIRKHWQDAAILVVVLVILSWWSWEDTPTEREFWRYYWYFKWALLTIFASVVYSLWVGFRIHLSAAPIVATTLLSHLWVIGGVSIYSGWSVNDQAYIKSMSGYGVFAFMLIVTAFSLVKEKHILALEKAMIAVCLSSAVYTLAETTHAPEFKRAAFVGNASMNGCLVAATIPFVVKRYKWLAVLPGLAVLATGQSVPIGVLALVLIPLSRRRLVGIALATGAFAVGIIHQGWATLFNSTGRFEQWRIIMNWWAENANPWIGAGAGSSGAVMPIAQREAGVQSAFYWWMHNDVLQVLFEQGVVGFAALLIFVAGLVWNARENKVLLASIIGYIGMACFNYPLRLPVTVLLGGTLVAMTYRGLCQPQNPKAQ